MKIIAPIVSALTIGLIALLVIKLKLLDSFFGIVLIIILLIAGGFYLWKNSKELKKAKVGLGIFSGGVISLISLAIFMVYLILNWPK